MQVDEAFPSPAAGLVGDPSGLALLPVGVPLQVAEVLPGVLHALGEEVPGRPARLERRAVALVAEGDATDVVRVVLGVPVPTLPGVATSTLDPRAASEAPARRASPGPTTVDRHVTAFHVVGEGALVALDQEAEADTTVAERAVLHETRGIAKLVPSGATDLPSCVRVGRGLGVALAGRQGAVSTQGQSYTVLVGAIRGRLVGPNVATLAATAVADLRGPRPTSGHALVGPSAEEATTWPVEHAVVGLPIPVVRAVEVEVVAA